MPTPIPFDSSDSAASGGGCLLGIKVKKFRLDQSDCTITVELGRFYILKNGLTAVALQWSEKGALMLLIPADRYMSGRGLEVAAFDCGDGDIFAPLDVSAIEEPTPPPATS